MPQGKNNLKAELTKGLQQLLNTLLSSPTIQLLLKRLPQNAAKLDPFGRDEEFMELVRPLFQFLYAHYFRVDVVGAEHLPQKGRGMIVANHSGTLPYDGAMLHLAVFNEHSQARLIRFLVDDFVYDLPVIGAAVRRLGGMRASPENATQLLKAGQMIAVFPEGIKGIGKLYEQKYQLQRFGRGGFVRLAMQTKTSIIPTAIIGAEETHPLIGKSETFAKGLGLPYIPITPTFPCLGPLGMIPLPTKWKIVFGKPISFARSKPSDAHREKLVARKTEEIRSVIQQTINHELKKRTSIWY